MNTKDLSKFLTTFLNRLDTKALGNMLNSMMKDNAGTLGGFSAKLVENLDAASTGNLVSELIDSLDAAQLGMFTSELVDNLDADLVGNFSATLVDNLNAEPMGSLVNAVISKQEVSAFVLETMDYIDNQELIGLINDVFGKTFEKNYAAANIIMPAGHIVSMTIILPPELQGLFGGRVTLPVEAYADIALGKAYITNLWLEEYPLPPEVERLNK
jgi:hypothetical protein